MVSTTVFARLAARPVDRVHIAASVVPTRDELHAIEGFVVSPGDAALVAAFLARDGMSWDQVRLPMRYQPESRIRARLHECVEQGVITLAGDHVAYTADGAAAAQAVFDAHALVLQRQWANTAVVVSELRALAEPVGAAAAAAGKPSSQLVDRTLSATVATDASALWRSLAKIRRYRADCHAEAWTEAGHSVDSITALAPGAPERQPIEDRTDELNAALWSHLGEDQQLRFMAGLAALDGSGTPT